jgi:UDP-N-acetylglucosamine 2-epimerase (non-hydrolysing)
MPGQRVLVVMGTRPEVIKLAPVVLRLQEDPHFDPVVCSTGQHRELLDQALDVFGLVPDVDLGLMAEDQTPADVLSAGVSAVGEVVGSLAPEWTLVQGDTTSALAGALAAAYAGGGVGHVEAGLRSHDRRRPFPEELNRTAISAVADVHFAPTGRSAANLLAEGHPTSTVFLTGNTVIDALLWVAERVVADDASVPPWFHDGRSRVLVTCHRRENFGAPMEEAFLGLRDVATALGPSVGIVFPVHPNPNVGAVAERILGGLDNVALIDPVDYRQLVGILKGCRLVITDSGGLQEEAPSLSVPVLVLRDVTERPEAVEAGTAKLVGCDRGRIAEEAIRLLGDPDHHASMARRANPYGDGRAAGRIVDVLAGRRIAELEAPSSGSAPD